MRQKLLHFSFFFLFLFTTRKKKKKKEISDEPGLEFCSEFFLIFWRRKFYVVLFKKNFNRPPLLRFRNNIGQKKTLKEEQSICNISPRRPFILTTFKLKIVVLDLIKSKSHAKNRFVLLSGMHGISKSVIEAKFYQ